MWLSFSPHIYMLWCHCTPGHSYSVLFLPFLFQSVRSRVVQWFLIASMISSFKSRLFSLAAAIAFSFAFAPSVHSQDTAAAATPALNPHDIIPSPIGPGPRIAFAQKLNLSGIPNAGNVDGLLF